MASSFCRPKKTATTNKWMNLDNSSDSFPEQIESVPTASEPLIFNSFGLRIFLGSFFRWRTNSSPSSSLRLHSFLARVRRRRVGQFRPSVRRINGSKGGGSGCRLVDNQFQGTGFKSRYVLRSIFSLSFKMHSYNFKEGLKQTLRNLDAPTENHRP